MVTLVVCSCGSPDSNCENIYLYLSVSGNNTDSSQDDPSSLPSSSLQVKLIIFVDHKAMDFSLANLATISMIE